MKKVVCARCGLVNLDKFVSFPHCAACGALLQVTQAPPRWRRVWRRPVRPIYWMLAVGSGLATLGFAIASIARETQGGGDKPLLVYAQIPRKVAKGQQVVAKFTLDSALENAGDSFENVSLRLTRETQRQFVIILVKPPPDAIEMRGRGRYYLWKELPRGSAIQLTIMPRQTAPNRGTLSLQATLWAAQYEQFEVRASIETTVETGIETTVKSNIITVAPAAVATAPATPMQTPLKVGK